MAGTGPCYMSLDLELLRVLTAGDAAALQELLRRREDQTSGHVAVNVQATAPTDALAAQPCPGTSCLLGVTSNGNTALHLVASRGHADLAALICERTPSLAATRNTFLDTPLHCAAREGHREAAACLVATMRAGGRAGELAAALRARNCLAATALYEAVRHRCAGVVELLMTEAPELASVETEDGSSPLYLAASIRSQELVRTLLRASPDGTPSPASFSGPEGRTALHAAAAATSHEMAQEILSWKPQGPTLLTRVDSTGRTPLQVAVMYGRLRTVQLFLDDITSAEQVRISDNHGLFPVHTAAIFPEEDAIRLMRNTKEYREFTWLKLKQLLLNGRATLIIDTLFKKCPGYYKMRPRASPRRRLPTAAVAATDSGGLAAAHSRTAAQVQARGGTGEGARLRDEHGREGRGGGRVLPVAGVFRSRWAKARSPFPAHPLPTLNSDGGFGLDASRSKLKREIESSF
uniref:Uncharacterized protein n=1 Tax=Setaria italica TaxID=4555 RepID=K3ZT37_SETIT